MARMDDSNGRPAAPRPPGDEPAASPFLVGPDDPGPPPARRRGGLPVGVGAAAAAAIVVALVLWGIAPRSASVKGAAGKGSVLEPIQPRADAQTGERVAPFSGFAVSVETDPPGAVVSVAGVPRGEAPVLAGIDCAPGDPVEISAQKKGFALAQTATTCRRDALVKLTVRLRR